MAKMEYRVKDVLKFALKMIGIMIVGGMLSSSGLGAMKTLVIIIGMIQVIPMIINAFAKGTNGWVGLGIVLLALVVYVGGDLFVLVGTVIAGVALAYIPLEEIAYNGGSLQAAIKKKNNMRIFRAISGLVADICFVGTGVMLAVCAFVPALTWIASTFAYVSFLGYVAKLVFNILCKDFRN